MKRLFEILCGLIVIAIPTTYYIWLIVLGGMIEADNFSLAWTLIPAAAIMYVYVKIVKMIYGD